jgi:hypothetical protein
MNGSLQKTNESEHPMMSAPAQLPAHGAPLLCLFQGMRDYLSQVAGNAREK